MRVSLPVRSLTSQDPVAIETSFGVGWALLTAAPPSTSFEAEFDLDSPLSELAWTRVEQGPGTMQIDGEETLLRCRVEAVDPDGMSFLRLASDCLLMVDAPDTRPNVGDWLELRLGRSDLRVTPTGL